MIWFSLWRTITSKADKIQSISTQMFVGPITSRATGQKNDAVQDARDMYFQINKTAKNTITATTAIRQSTNQIVANPAIKPLPPFNLYQRGKQCPIMQKRPEKAAPNCHKLKNSLKNIAVIKTGRAVLKTSIRITDHAMKLLP